MKWKENKQSNDIAETFNTFLSKIGPELSKEIEDVDISCKDFLSETNEEFSFGIITQSQVLMHLAKLCRSKATGLDSSLARLLRECPELIAEVTPLWEEK